LQYFADGVDVVLATTSFAMGQVNPDGPTSAGWSVEALERLGVPVLQAIAVGSSHAQWDASPRGLTPVETAMNVALPEFDGRIITVPISFKELVSPEHLAALPDGRFEGPVVAYVAQPDRVARVVGLALRFAHLRRTPNCQKRIALILANYNAKASRIGNAVGLDTPASVLRLLHALRAAGYDIGDPARLPADGDALLAELIERCSYDTELLSEDQLATAAARVPATIYADWFASLPELNRRQIESRWGPPPGESYVHDGHLALAGLQFGNVFVAIQPPRGYGVDPNLIYHQPDLPPTHNYHALYRWIRDDFRADAMVHVGKHGTLEWLPGKAVGLSETCFPDQLLGDLPLIYPFIVNDPGEGAQAKRRAQAVIVDHLTPPMTTADTYGKLDELARLVDEYYQVEALDPSKLPTLQQQIWELVVEARLDADINLMIQNLNRQGDHTHDWDPQVTEEGTPVTLAEMRSKDFAHLIENLDGYLCELGSALIRGGLHTLGEHYTGERLRDLVQAMVRVPNLDVPSLRAGVASAFGLQLEALVDALGTRLQLSDRRLARSAGREVVTASDALEAIDGLCARLLEHLESSQWCVESAQRRRLAHAVLGTTTVPTGLMRTLDFIATRLIADLNTSADDEIGNLLNALEGAYVPAGPSGAPTRGMAHVLPTGRNFYAIDPRSMPSQSAWRVGQQLADALVERHQRETGAFPQSVGLSIWGTSAMRTHGDDIAQVFALLGVRPVWQSESRRLTGVEVVSLADLGRPRVDVVCRISGFFRDAFPHVLGILDNAVQQVADLDEPTEHNPLRARVLADAGRLKSDGLDSAVAERRARYRIFGSPPGTYGAGILPLIDEGNWQTSADFATAYVNWGGYAYTGDDYGVDARQDFETVLGRVQVAVKNQDNREHDIFDSDDYLQFHGGMIATIRGEEPVEQVFETAAPPVLPQFSVSGVPPRRGAAPRSAQGNVRRTVESPRGRHVRSSPVRTSALDIVATLCAAAPLQTQRRQSTCADDGERRIQLKRADLRFKIRSTPLGALTVFVVDASGSMAAQHRMALAKGAVMSLLLRAYQTRDEVALIAFRGGSAEVLLPPTSSVHLASIRLRSLPTGGRTPLALALRRGGALLVQRASTTCQRAAVPTLVVVSDGRANVALAGGDFYADALAEARLLRAAGVGAIVVDTEDGPIRLGRAWLLATELGAAYARLADLSAGVDRETALAAAVRDRQRRPSR
jgi:cobaltochelatase CobN